ncbi:CIC11C00000005525 [Sungouiella intermedia]|uniref:CIC11C00000005525 n=1 Tax=Sungouiella intermedia TaxID=45354 RepID=A0A1L0E208_9ASCO|nr:CIC11C00000005525 [[Candida] intermedia]
MDASYKKRHRIPASCLVCRKRKSKCDRTRPVCGTCKKKLIAHLCNYEDDALLPANNNTTYLPMAASPRPSIQYGQPAMNPSPHMAHPSFVPPPHGHPHGAPPPMVHMARCFHCLESGLQPSLSTLTCLMAKFPCHTTCYLRATPSRRNYSTHNIFLNIHFRILTRTPIRVHSMLMRRIVRVFWPLTRPCQGSKAISLLCNTHNSRSNHNQYSNTISRVIPYHQDLL